MSCRDICLKKYNKRHRYLPTNLKTSPQRASYPLAGGEENSWGCKICSLNDGSKLYSRSDTPHTVTPPYQKYSARYSTVRIQRRSARYSRYSVSPGLCRRAACRGYLR
eukprot:6599429-Prymnesium_polylepis.1